MTNATRLLTAMTPTSVRDSTRNALVCRVRRFGLIAISGMSSRHSRAGST